MKRQNTQSKVLVKWIAAIAMVLTVIFGEYTVDDILDALSTATMTAGAQQDVPTMPMDGALADAAVGIYMLNIGQGDAILIRAGKDYSLIDAGEDVKNFYYGEGPKKDRDLLMKELKKYKVKELKNIIISHPHADHYAGLVPILKAGIKVDKVYDNGVNVKTRSYHTYHHEIDKRKIPFAVLSEGDEVKLGDGVKFKILADGDSLGQNIRNLNNTSIVGRLTYKNFSMLFTGDAEKEEEQYLVNKYGAKLQSTVLKVGHHGSRTSSTDAFIAAVKPQYALISAGFCNEYNLPKPQALKRLDSGIKKLYPEITDNRIYRTDEEGTITVLTDGDKLSITAERPHPKTVNFEAKNYEECKKKGGTANGPAVNSSHTPKKASKKAVVESKVDSVAKDGKTAVQDEKAPLEVEDTSCGTDEVNKPSKNEDYLSNFIQWLHNLLSKREGIFLLASTPY